MPMYAYRCSECGSEMDAFNRVAECESNAPVCCGAPRKIVIQPVMGVVAGDVHYKCPVTGKEVTSMRQRRNIMAEKNLVDANDFPPEQAAAKAKKIHDENAALAAQLPQPEACKSYVQDIFDRAIPA